MSVENRIMNDFISDHEGRPRTNASPCAAVPAAASRDVGRRDNERICKR